MPAAPRVNGERYRGRGAGDPVSGVPRADAGAACHAPTKTEHRPIQKGEPARYADADRAVEVAARRTWLLSKGWRRIGLVDPAEVPGR